MSVVAPLYFAALAALALPWLLHRFSDASPERRPFPSTRFLEPTTPPVSRRRTLRHRALLALRVLALLALCVLFAEPWIPRPASLVDARALHVIAIDTSLSMRAGERFERALGIARERLADVPDGDEVRVIGFEREIVVFGESGSDASAARGALERLSPGYGAADYGRLMQRLDRLAEESSLPLRAVLVSDVQRTSLPDRRNALYAPRVASFEIVDVARGEVNVALMASARSEDEVQARVELTLLASGGATAPATGEEGVALADGTAFERVVTVAHEGDTLDQAPVRLVLGERARTVLANVVLPERTAPRFDVSLDRADALAEDDSVRVPVRFGGAHRIALAAIDTRVEPDTRVFVSTALEAGDRASVDTSTLAAGQLPDDEPRLVVFTPLADGEALPATLRRFVARGGSALVVDGATRSARRDVPDDERLRGSAVGRVDVSHPLALGEIDWGATRFFALGDYVPAAEDRVLIETEDRRPVLIERPSESGLALVLNERLDGEDSNLPFQPAFVTLMDRVLTWFDSGRAVPERVVIGEPVALPVNVQVLDPDGRALVALADTASAQTLAFSTPGIHTVIGALGEQALEVVLDPAESDLEPIPRADLDDWQARNDRSSAPRDTASAGDDAPADAASPSDSPSGSPPDSPPDSLTTPSASALPGRPDRLALWPVLLPLLAVLLLGETLFANRRLDVRRDGT